MKQFGPEVYQSGGTFSSMPSVPKNEIILFEKDTAVLGYALLTTVDDEIVYISKGSASGGDPGGAVKPGSTWTLTVTIPDHQHDVDHTHTTGDVTLTAAQSGLPAHTHTYLVNYANNEYISSDNWYSIIGRQTSGTTNANVAQNASESHNHGATNASSISVTGAAGAESIDLSTWRPLGRCFTRQGRL
jgi:microcystin-dependent protein